jgi:hypothetical protein
MQVVSPINDLTNLSSSPPSFSNDDERGHMNLIVITLQFAFGNMEYSNNSICSLDKFTELLGIDKGEQQDPQEFNKLFITKIEKLCSEKIKKSIPSIPQLLNGRENYSTQCLNCNNKCVKEYEFHELDLSVDNIDNIEDALKNYFSSEELVGANQYHCDKCFSKQDAIRYSEVSIYPSILYLHLQRYIYDRNSGDKVKSKKEVKFPNELILGNEEYILVAVLYHKGNSAYGGHYIADVLEWESGKWWLFDDDFVSLSSNPSISTSNNQDSNTSDSTTNNNNQMSNVKSNIESSSRNKCNNKKKKQNQNNNQPQLKDAYMLSYVKKANFIIKITNKTRTHLIPQQMKVNIDLQNINLQNEVMKYKESCEELIQQASLHKDNYALIEKIITPKKNEKFHLVPTEWLQEWIVSGNLKSICINNDNIDNNNDNSSVLDLTSTSPMKLAEKTNTEIIKIDDDGDVNNDNIINSINNHISSINLCQFKCVHKKSNTSLNPNSLNKFKFISQEAFQLIIAGSPNESNDSNDHSNLSDLTVPFWSTENIRCDLCCDDYYDSRKEWNNKIDKYRKTLDAIDSKVEYNTISNENSCLILKSWVTALRYEFNSIMKRIANVKNNINNDKKINTISFKTINPTCDSGNKVNIDTIDPTINKVLFCKHNQLKSGFKKRTLVISSKSWQMIRKHFPEAIQILGIYEYYLT